MKPEYPSCPHCGHSMEYGGIKRESAREAVWFLCALDGTARVYRRSHP